MVRIGLSVVALVLAGLGVLGGVARAGLPDGRRYELVSPADKNGADVLVFGMATRAAADGNAVQFSSLTAFGDALGNFGTTEYVALRGATGWSVHAITPAQQPLSFQENIFSWRPRFMGEFSPDLSKGLFVGKTALTDDPNVASVVNLYRREDARTAGPGSYTLMSGADTPQAPSDRISSWPGVAGSTADLSHVLFESRRNLTADALGLPVDQVKLYENVGDAVRLVGQVPTAGASSCGAGGGACVPSVSKAGQGAVDAQYTERTISPDGSRVVFTAPPFDGAGGVLYLRNDQGTPGSGDDTTTQINVSERTDCADHDPCTGVPEPDPNGSQPATFWSADKGLTQVFFTSKEQLTDDDQNPFIDLYRYDAGAPVGERLTRLSVDSEPSDGDGADVSGVIGASEDGSYVYFTVTQGQLVAGGPTGSTGGPVGGERIFLWHAGSITEVGAINGSLEQRFIVGSLNWGLSEKWSRITPDGTHLVFQSEGTDELTGYNHGTACSSDSTDPPCLEVYVYDATANGGAGRLLCASCNPTGAPATTDATFIARFAEGLVLGSSHLTRAVSDDGRFVFFTTAERLVGQDVNGKRDAYEYDTVSRRVHLLSTGQSPSDSFFVEASASGHDVFIATRERLSPRDVDQGMDLYDVRVNGSTETAPSPTVPCTEVDSCHGAASGPAAALIPGSSVFRGRGVLRVPGPFALFTVTAPSRVQRRRWARSGRGLVVVSASQPGTVTVRLSIHHAHHTQTVANATARLRHGASVRLLLVLNKSARAQLARAHRLRLTLSAVYSHAARPQVIHFTLKDGTAHAAANAPRPAATAQTAGDTTDPVSSRQASIAAVQRAGQGVGGGGSLLGAPLAVPDGPFGVLAFDGQVTADSGGTPFTQAGGHPFALTTLIRWNRVTDPLEGRNWPAEAVKDVFVDAPPGLIGNPTAVAKCSLSELVAPSGQSPTCTPDAQVGVARLTLPSAGVASVFSLEAPVYALVPPPNVPARFGFNLAGTIVTLDGELRSSGDYGLSVNVRNAGETLPIIGSSVTLWGIPADPRHDPQRACPGQQPPSLGGPHCPATGEPQAFLTLPTACDGPLTTRLRTDSWVHPGRFVTASFQSHLPPGLRDDPPGSVESPALPPDRWGPPQGPTGCDQVPFDPTFTATPDATASPGPSGWSFDLAIPQDHIADPNALAQAHLKKATVTLPAGVRVSPSSASGLGACTLAQIALHSQADPTCPDSSKIGTLTIDTPLLEDQLTGAVYLAKPHDNPSNSLLAIYLVAKGPGVVIKLPGGVSPNGATGQLSATFDNNPQLPFSKLHLHFFGGSRAALSNPPRCGTYTTKAILTSWSGKTVESDSSFTTSHDGHGAPCPAPRFRPQMIAGTTNSHGGVPSGGSYSTFSLTVTRSDDDQELAKITHLQLPSGLLARVAGVPMCPARNARAGTCDASSRIGSVTASAGPGPDPFTVTSGRVYFAGPYKGAPFSLVFVVPAIAGPFDLGTVVVRDALFVNPATATIENVTDPLPTTLQGIPLQVRILTVTIDRPRFIINPTSCAPKRITATLQSTGSLVAHPSSHFQVADCAALPLDPQLTLTVGSNGHVKHGASTPLITTLRQTRGQSGLQSVSVTLPATLNARLGVVNNACTQAQFDTGHCQDARAGTATAITPLLAHPLHGGVYFVKDPDKPAGSLPNLVVALRGQVDVNLTGKVKIPGGTLLSTSFTTIPDVPIKRFTLKLAAGPHGPLGAAANLCSPHARQATAQIRFQGQNGDVIQTRQKLRIRGCHHHRPARR